VSGSVPHPVLTVLYTTVEPESSMVIGKAFPLTALPSNLGLAEALLFVSAWKKLVNHRGQEEQNHA
jgi:hypothetical protein